MTPAKARRNKNIWATITAVIIAAGLIGWLNDIQPIEGWMLTAFAWMACAVQARYHGWLTGWQAAQPKPHSDTPADCQCPNGPTGPLLPIPGLGLITNRMPCTTCGLMGDIVRR